MFHGTQGLRLAAFRLDRHAIVTRGKRHHIRRTKFEGFEHLSGNHDLTALSHAADPFPGWGCLGIVMEKGQCKTR
jgi:hypothetical protein